MASLGILLSCTASQQGLTISNSAEEQGDPRVGQYISSQWSFETSSFWIEGPEGLILIDTQFLPSALRKGLAPRDALARSAEKVTLRYPHHRYPVFLPMLLGAEWARQAAESHPSQ
ncbi:hypothetical protein [Hyalangium sp.]|uniref:hypothetical protein n=1 Tax=Hyalangium sp. TaxID=2028555 RepID=UPI002D611400|nr:hypothetical protein [Hyalangium sp.]HYH98056.1 hypothetical protein [Hyalangium sp.]